MNSPEPLSHILIVEDQINWRRLYKVWLKEQYQISFATNQAEALDLLTQNDFGLVIMDLGLPSPEEGLSALRTIQTSKKQIKIIVITAMGDRSYYLKVQEMGVYAVFSKNERLETDIPIFVRKALDMNALERENHLLRLQVNQEKQQMKILGTSRAAENLREDIDQLSQTNTPVLLTGATGVGKSYLAKYIHLQSKRAQFPFIVLNCANLPEYLIESELFGHEKGAFTGADKTKEGKFKLADKGTVLLDEIAEIPSELQAKLLRVIEEHRFFPLGGQREIAVDVRILAATNRNLNAEIDAGIFRSDLYYRLAGYHLVIPDLNERAEDIPEYFNEFLRELCYEEGMPVPECESGIYEILQKTMWPGNIRELKNVVTRLLIFRPVKITIPMVIAEIENNQNTVLDQALVRDYSLKELSSLYAQELLKKYGKKKKVTEILKIDNKTLKKYLEMQVLE